MLRTIITTCVIAWGVAAAAFAQSAPEGTIRGYVRDSQGAVLPGVAVTATDTTAGVARTAVTDSEGVYRLVNLAPGTYTLTAELQGFSRFVRDSVVVRTGLNIGVDITLKVGALTEIVEVKARDADAGSRRAPCRR